MSAIAKSAASTSVADDLVRALLLPFGNGTLAFGGCTLFLNARPGAEAMLPPETIYQQPDRALYNRLVRIGAPVQPELPPPDEKFATVLVAGSRHHRETLYLLACAAAYLEPGGLLVCAAHNLAGGGRLKKDLQKAGFETCDLSKYKCRVVWARNEGALDQGLLGAWREGGAPQPIIGGAFISQPGLFGWDKIDLGSALLALNLPEGQRGIAADFGCGYGYLSAALLEKSPELSALYAIDSDERAVRLCVRNMAARAQNVAFTALWDDLTAPQHRLPPLDLVVMNPPFHTGKQTVSTLGRTFITQAASRLKKGGALWMVANVHLPYEDDLRALFRSTDIITQEQGFKIIHATK